MPIQDDRRRLRARARCPMPQGLDDALDCLVLVPQLHSMSSASSTEDSPGRGGPSLDLSEDVACKRKRGLLLTRDGICSRDNRWLVTMSSKLRHDPHFFQNVTTRFQIATLHARVKKVIVSSLQSFRSIGLNTFGLLLEQPQVLGVTRSRMCFKNSQIFVR